MFTYWQSPVISSAKMNSLGNSIHLKFDQDTDMDGMGNNCSKVLNADILPILSSNQDEVRCIWKSADFIDISLGIGATVVPGDKIGIKPNLLRSANRISRPSSSQTTISAPDFIIAPAVSVMGKNVIDPCSELELTALCDSPRPLVFSWSLHVRQCN